MARRRAAEGADGQDPQAGDRGPGALSPEELIAGLPAARRNSIRRLDALVRATVPALDAHVRDGMLGYGSYRYRYKSGREGEASRIAIGANARAVSLHVAALAGEEETLVEAFAGRLGEGARTGRTTVQFSKLDQLELEPLRDLLRQAATLPPPGMLSDGG